MRTTATSCASRRLAVAAVVCLALVAGLAANSAAGEGEWVSFNAASPGSGDPLRGFLARPEGDGPFPGIVLLHDCRGPRPYQREWARVLSASGYAVLLVNSFFTRHASGVCANLDTRAGHPEVDGRIADAHGALAYLSARPWIDPDRVAVGGWARAAVLRAVADDEPGSATARRFAAAIAIAPDCGAAPAGRFTAPVLVLAGERDDWTPMKSCRRMAMAASRGAYPVELKVYPGALHGFDDPEVGHRLELDDAWNPYRAGGRGATLGYDRGAHDDALETVAAFLAEHVGARWAAGDRTARPTIAGMPPGATWVVDPTVPGPDLPPVGRSTFDLLFTRETPRGREWDVPWPFDRVVARLREAAGAGADGLANVKTLLIPLGRSLQRDAAAPAYFTHPRVVVAVDGDAASAAALARPAMLKDRVFLGYQERGRLIEVISYNEAAARFEFQLVENYHADGAPRVRYARRAVCTSCHQGGSPIFAEAGWDETNGNHSISERLRAAGGAFHGVSANSTSITPAAVDNATDRANLLSAWQLLWRDGCGAGAAGARCRGAALLAMVQRRLSRSGGFDAQAAGFREDYLATMRALWQQRWPAGLAIPSPNIPNREPLLSASPSHIPAELDPLNARAPLEVWRFESDRDLSRLVEGLSDSLPSADLARLDRHLYELGQRSGATRRHLETPCEAVLRGGVSGALRVEVECGSAAGAEFSMSADLVVRGAEAIEGSVRRLALPDGTSWARLALVDGAPGAEETHRSARLAVRHRIGGARLRLPDGTAVESIEIRWPDDVRGRTEAHASLTILSDFEPVPAAIEGLVRRNDRDAVGAGPFRGTHALGAVLAALGLPRIAWCCDDPADLPAAIVTETPPATFGAGESPSDERALRSLFGYCGSCHLGHARMPPGFLAGDDVGALAKISQCAERIYYRLHMWRLDDGARAKSPMPPAHALASRRSRDDGVERDMAQLKAWIRGRLGARDADAIVASDYESLRACLTPAKAPELALDRR